MPVTTIRFDHVRKRYGAHEVLRDISFDIGPGEFFGLAGMNGAGKTTLIKCLLDFCQTDGGRIEVFGLDPHLTEARRRLAFLPERFLPPYYLTGQDFLKYMLKLQALPYRQEQAEAMLHALDLDLAALARPVRSYSKGMTQKLGLAACFLADKDLYVFDEPMSGLDPKARALLKTRLQALHDAGRSLFFSSHALADVEEICDRMAILHDGQLRFIGSPAECCRQYGAATLEQAYLKCIG